MTTPQKRFLVTAVVQRTVLSSSEDGAKIFMRNELEQWLGDHGPGELDHVYVEAVDGDVYDT